MSTTLSPEEQPDPNKNDVLMQSRTRKIEFDKVCHGPFKYAVFGRAHEYAQWHLMGEAETYEEALAMSKDEQRELADLGLTEVERQKRTKASP